MKGLKILLVSLLLVPCVFLFAACSSDDADSFKGVVYGDVNCDGVIDYTDCLVLMKYLNGDIKLSPTAFANSAVYNGRDITYADVVLIKYYAEDKITTLKPGKHGVLFGDVNGDGKVNEDDSELLRRYVAGHDVQIKALNSKVSFNGADNEMIDMVDVVALARYTDKKSVDNAHFIIPYIAANDLFGDINCDGKFDSIDLTFMAEYAAGTRELSLQSIRNIGVYKDGKWQLLTTRQQLLDYFS